MIESEIDMLYYVRTEAPSLFEQLGVEELCKSYHTFRKYIQKEEPEKFVSWLYMVYMRRNNSYEIRNNIQT